MPFRFKRRHLVSFYFEVVVHLCEVHCVSLMRSLHISFDSWYSSRAENKIVCSQHFGSLSKFDFLVETITLVSLLFISLISTSQLGSSSELKHIGNV